MIESCHYCHAQLQEVRIGTERMLRCPWVKDKSEIDASQTVKRIYCKRPYSGTKHPDGLALRSVQ